MITQTDLLQRLAIPHHAKAAYRELFALSFEGVPLALEGLRHASAAVRHSCCAFLDHFLVPEALPDLIAMLDDPAPGVRVMTLHTLACERCKEGACRPEERVILPAALRILNEDPDAHVRAMAIEVVGQYVHTNPVAAQALVAAQAHDQSPAVRKKAAWYAPGGPIFKRTIPRPPRTARPPTTTPPATSPNDQAKTMQASVVVLDLDGVILKTNLLKYRAMLALFADYVAEQQRISDYILAHGGVPRREKLATILRELVNVPPTPALLEDYLTRYATALEDALANAPIVEGVAEFLAAGGRTFYLCSSAPVHEVHQQLATRGLLPHFTGIYSGQTPKAEALRQISATHPIDMIVFFGDAVGDRAAALAAGVAFVGVINERDNFAQESVVKLVDFTHIATVEAAIQRAWQEL